MFNDAWARCMALKIHNIPRSFISINGLTAVDFPTQLYITTALLKALRIYTT